MPFFLRMMRAALVAGGLLVLILAQPGFASEAPGTILARMDISGPVSSFPLPSYAQLQDATGQFYLLIEDTSANLAQSGQTFQILDPDATAGNYILAVEFRSGARPAAHAQFRVVHDDGRRLVIRSEAVPADIEALSLLGFQCRPLPAIPLKLELSSRAPAAATPRTTVTSNALVSAMISGILQTNLYTAMTELSGLQPVVAGGSYTNIRTRYQSSGTPVRRATELAYEHFLALGLQPSYQSWSAGGYSNRNVIGTLPGTTSSAQIVVVCAHIDDMPSGSLAPGADDNASGSVAVLAAAEALCKYSFERTLRFVLFTGEEQGLYGSDAYAAACSSAGDNLVAVYNLDMVAWDGNSDRILNLYIRPGNTNELDAAAVLTNVARVYGLTNAVAPAIVSETTDWSDHYSFNSYGFPALCAIEEDVNDFNPYYHTTNDTLARCNLPFFTKSVQAVAGAAAHYARPVQRILFDAVQVQNGAFLATTNVGTGSFVARHESGAAEGSDARDTAWSGMATNPNAAWLKIYTDPYTTGLAIDSRPTNSETIFRGKLAAVKTTAGALTCTNRLRFDFTAGTETNCTYLVHVTVDSNATPGKTAFDCITNLAQVVSNGGFLNLPGLSAVTNGTVYGTCEIARRFVTQAASNLVLDLPQVTANTATLALPCQPGVRVVDSVEYTTNLFPAAPWVPLATFTNNPAPDAASFESGWISVGHVLDTSGPGAFPVHYFRIRRQWPAP